MVLALNPGSFGVSWLHWKFLDRLGYKLCLKNKTKQQKKQDTVLLLYIFYCLYKNKDFIVYFNKNAFQAQIKLFKKIFYKK